MRSYQGLLCKQGRLTGLCILGLGGVASATTQEAAAITVEEVVVTAQRRVETLQKVPISITALSAEQVRQLNLTKASDLSGVAPGIFAAGSMGESNPIFAIRGIGLNDVFSNNNPTVGVYLDDIIQPYTPLLSFPVFDLERIEVLKGPQGTLYGRNTTGGAINFISKAPTQDFDAYMSASYGRFERAEIEGAIGGGLADNLALRLAGKAIEQADGWQTNAVTGEKIGDKDVKAARVMALWTPMDELEVLFKASVLNDRSDNQIPEHVAYNAPDGGPCQGFLDGVRDEGNCVDILGYFDPTPDRRVVEGSEVYGHESETDSRDFMLNLKWDLGAASLTAVTGYIDYQRASGVPGPSRPTVLSNHFKDDIEAFSQELRLASDDEDRFSWMIGAYYSWDELRSRQLTALDDLFFRTRVGVHGLQTTTSHALFSQLQWRLTDRLRLVGGARYTEEKKDFVYDAFDTDPFGTSAFLPTPVAGIDDTSREDVVTGKVGLDFDLTEDLMLYASASKGFKSGGYNSAIAFNPAQLEPFVGENLYAYELGAKSSWLDGRLHFNTALYYYDYQDLQAFVTETRGGGINVIVLNNAGDARVYGLEAELTARPTKRLLLRLSANTMDSKITEINPGAQADYEGNRLANAPELSANAVVRYDLPTESLGFASYAMLDGAYRGKTYYSVNNRGQSSMDAYSLLNGRVGFTTLDERWELALWGRNLTDKLYVSMSYDSYGGIFPSMNFLGEPRSYGVSVAYRY